MDVVIAPSECKKLLQIRLPRPKDGKGQHYFYDETTLSIYEVVKFSDKYRSWFIDNLLCSDGHFSMMTRVDPLFMFIPLISCFANDKFRSLDDICQEYNVNFIVSSDMTGTSNSNQLEKYSRIEYALSPDIEWSNICDIKDNDGDLYMRFSKSRTIDWLLRKHDKLMASLRGELPVNSSKATMMSYATDLLGDYTPQWLQDDFKKEVRSKHLLSSGN